VTFLIVFVSIGVALLSAFLKRFKCCIGALSISFLIMISIGTGVIPHGFMYPLESAHLYKQANTPVWKKKNLILILGMGTIKIPDTKLVVPGILAYSRIHQGATLYHTCKKSGNQCKILITGGDMSATGQSEASVYKHELLKLNIENADIGVETRSLNTFQNAEFCAPLIQQEAPEQVFLVTAGIHMQRSLLYCKHFSIDAIPAPSDYMRTYASLLPIGYNMTMADFALHEYIGILRYHVYQYLGLNKKIATTPLITSTH